ADHHPLDQRMLRHADALIADDRHWHLAPPGDLVDLLLYRAGVGIDQDLDRHGAPSLAWNLISAFRRLRPGAITKKGRRLTKEITGIAPLISALARSIVNRASLRPGDEFPMHHLQTRPVREGHDCDCRGPRLFIHPCSRPGN